MAISGKMSEIWGKQKSGVREMEEATAQYQKEVSSLDKLFGVGEFAAKALLPDFLDPLVAPLAEESKDWLGLRPSKKGIKEAEGTWSYGIADPTIAGLTKGEEEVKKGKWEEMFSNLLGQFSSGGVDVPAEGLFGGLDRSQPSRSGYTEIEDYNPLGGLFEGWSFPERVQGFGSGAKRGFSFGMEGTPVNQGWPTARGGGKVPNYKQGGTIAEYFSLQNKTLGGSSIKSMGGK